MQHQAPPKTTDALLRWLGCSDEPSPQPAAAALGFGHFDARIPLRCGELALAGLVKHVFFTGGIGAGTADLGRPEADVFSDSLRLWFPSIAPDSILSENRSTNTAENIRFPREIWEAAGLGPALREHGVLLVATPVRMRRVLLTWKKLAPEIPATCRGPAFDVASETILYRARGLNLEGQIANEWERLRAYPDKGWIEKPDIPPEILRTN